MRRDLPRRRVRIRDQRQSRRHRTRPAPRLRPPAPCPHLHLRPGPLQRPQNRPSPAHDLRDRSRTGGRHHGRRGTARPNRSTGLPRRQDTLLAHPPRRDHPRPCQHHLPRHLRQHHRPRPHQWIPPLRPPARHPPCARPPPRPRPRSHPATLLQLSDRVTDVQSIRCRNLLHRIRRSAGARMRAPDGARVLTAVDRALSGS